MMTYVYTAFAIVLALAIGVSTVQTIRLHSLQSEFSDFKAQVKIEGEIAQTKAKEIEAKNKLTKETTDANNAKLRSANAALTKRLRDARASSSALPPAPAGSTSPNTATVNRAEFERAFGLLDQEVQGLVEEGDSAVIDLNSAKQWAKDNGQ
jgi:hypothetical protein